MGQSTTVIPTGGGGAKVQDSIPTNPQKGDLWVDTSETPPLTKWYDGTSFNIITPVNTSDNQFAGVYNIELDGFSISSSGTTESIVIDFPHEVLFTRITGNMNNGGSANSGVDAYFTRNSGSDVSIGNLYGLSRFGNGEQVNIDVYSGLKVEVTDTSYSTGDFQLTIPSTAPSHSHSIL